MGRRVSFASGFGGETGSQSAPCVYACVRVVWWVLVWTRTRCECRVGLTLGVCACVCDVHGYVCNSADGREKFTHTQTCGARTLCAPRDASSLNESHRPHPPEHVPLTRQSTKGKNSLDTKIDGTSFEAELL